MKTSAHFAAVIADHVTPIRCSYCGADAHLLRRLPAVTGDGRGELRIFRCDACRQRTDMFIRD
jgi:hypothetical protein